MLSLNNKPELALLLCCSRTRIEPDVMEQIKRLITQDIDWDYLLDLATQHGVAPLLYKNLKEHAPGLLPHKARVSLRDIVLHNTAHNLRLLYELKRITKAFADRNIPMIPFKGPALAEMVYGSMALRRASCDLDLVVCKTDIPAAMAMLQEMGYRLFAPIKNMQKHLEFRYHLGLAGPNGLLLELHWHVVPRYLATFTMPNLVARRLDAVSPEISCSTFAPQDLFLLLCIHATKDFWLSLSLMCDLNELLAKHPDLDQADIIKKSRTQGHYRIALVGFYLTKALFSATLSPAVEEAISSDPGIARLGSRIIVTLFSKKNWTGKTRLIIFKYRLFFAIHERMRDKFRIFWGKIIQISAE